MTEVQSILKAMAVSYHDGLIGEEGCETLAKALDGVPPEYHMGALKAFVGVEKEEQKTDNRR